MCRVTDDIIYIFKIKILVICLHNFIILRQTVSVKSSFTYTIVNHDSMLNVITCGSSGKCYNV